jgi:hypothetical protein
MKRLEDGTLDMSRRMAERYRLPSETDDHYDLQRSDTIQVEINQLSRLEPVSIEGQAIQTILASQINCLVQDSLGNYHQTLLSEMAQSTDTNSEAGKSHI